LGVTHEKRRIVFLIAHLLRPCSFRGRPRGGRQFPNLLPEFEAVLKAETINKMTYLPLKEIIEFLDCHIRIPLRWKH